MTGYNTSFSWERKEMDLTQDQITVLTKLQAEYVIKKEEKECSENDIAIYRALILRVLTHSTWCPRILKGSTIWGDKGRKGHEIMGTIFDPLDSNDKDNISKSNIPKVNNITLPTFKQMYKQAKLGNSYRENSILDLVSDLNPGRP